MQIGQKVEACGKYKKDLKVIASLKHVVDVERNTHFILTRANLYAHYKTKGQK